jgi:hypothetical protein
MVTPIFGPALAALAVQTPMPTPNAMPIALFMDESSFEMLVPPGLELARRL